MGLKKVLQEDYTNFLALLHDYNLFPLAYDTIREVQVGCGAGSPFQASPGNEKKDSKIKEGPLTTQKLRPERGRVGRSRGPVPPPPPIGEGLMATTKPHLLRPYRRGRTPALCTTHPFLPHVSNKSGESLGMRKVKTLKSKK